MQSPSRLSQWLSFLVCGLGWGAGLGAVLGAVNGLLSPAYFAVLFFNADFDWLAASSGAPSHVVSWKDVAPSGCLQGAWLGATWAALFGFYATLASRRRIEPFQLLAYYRVMGLGVCVFWVLGGLDCALVSVVASHFVRDLFQLGFSWVQGSVWGAYGGVVASLLYACGRWQRNYLRERHASQSRGNVAATAEPSGEIVPHPSGA